MQHSFMIETLYSCPQCVFVVVHSLDALLGTPS